MPPSYPRIGSAKKYSASAFHSCRICGRPKADTQVLVQMNVYRADDDRAHVHAVCLAPLSETDFLTKLGYIRDRKEAVIPGEAS